MLSDFSKSLLEKDSFSSNNNIDIVNLKTNIIKKLDNNSDVPEKWLARYLNDTYDLYVNVETSKVYKKDKKGFLEVDVNFISEFFNTEFGKNEIKRKTLENVLSYVTDVVETDYNVLQFKNGYYNTHSRYFKEDGFLEDKIPKMDLTQYNYYSEDFFEATELYDEIKAIVSNDVWEFNEELFYKAVGNTFTAENLLGVITIFVGKSGTGKSTLLELLKHIFPFSSLKIHTIAKNERFTLLDSVGKCINIDDDAQGDMIRSLGALNTFITGNTLKVEIKNKNDSAELNANTTPRIFGASNRLPPIIGDGFKRRLLLIKCDNEIPKQSMNARYTSDIHNGKREDEIEQFISYSLNNFDSTPISSEIADTMEDEFNIKSYAEDVIVKKVFIDYYDYMELYPDSDIDIKEAYITLNDAYNEINIAKKYFYDAGMIFREQLLDRSIRKYRQAMERNGFSPKQKRITRQATAKEEAEDGSYTVSTNEQVFDLCIINPKWLIQKNHLDMENT